MKPSLSKNPLNNNQNNTNNNSSSTIPWPNPSSRIIRVSRISGGKDRHSKVWTVKGLRDRRVRLSVSTAIQFYDLQDRLGYDQPSKAVDWLIKAAADSILHLPALPNPFPLPPSLDSKSERERSGSFTELLTEPSFASLLQFGEQQDLQQFGFVNENGVGRGTLQSNWGQQHHGVYGGSLPVFFGAAIPISAAMEGQFEGGFDGRLQLCCSEARKQVEMKGERKG